jgi:hypothetical protein
MNKKTIIIIAGIVLLVGASVVGVYAYSSKKKSIKKPEGTVSDDELAPRTSGGEKTAAEKTADNIASGKTGVSIDDLINAGTGMAAALAKIRQEGKLEKEKTGTLGMGVVTAPKNELKTASKVPVTLTPTSREAKKGIGGLFGGKK